MNNPFEGLFNPGSTPLKRDSHFRIKVDDDGNPVLEPIQGVSIHVSPEGSTDITTVTPDRFYSCGHSATEHLGGRCGEPGCNHTTCQRCFVQCSQCLIPLCTEHTRWYQAEPSVKPVPLCQRCFEKTIRKQIKRKLWNKFISFFVQKPNSSHE